MIVEGGKGQPAFALLTLGVSILAKVIHLDPTHISFMIEKVAFMSSSLECCLKSPTRMRRGDVNPRCTTAVPPCLTHRYVFLVHKNKLTLDVISCVPKIPHQVPTTTWPPSCSFSSESEPPPIRFSSLNHTSHLLPRKGTEAVKISQGSSALVPRLYPPVSTILFDRCKLGPKERLL